LEEEKSYLDGSYIDLGQPESARMRDHNMAELKNEIEDVHKDLEDVLRQL